MSYIEDNLMDDEQIIIQTRVHPIILLKPIFWTCILGGILKFVWNVKVLFLVVSALIGMSLIQLLVGYIYYRGAEYGITTKRVLGKTGFIWRNSLDILLTKVEAVRLNQDIQGRIFDYGDIEVIGTGGTDELLMLIPRPLVFRKKLQEQVSLAQETIGSRRADG